MTDTSVTKMDTTSASTTVIETTASSATSGKTTKDTTATNKKVPKVPEVLLKKRKLYADIKARRLRAQVQAKKESKT